VTDRRDRRSCFVTSAVSLGMRTPSLLVTLAIGLAPSLARADRTDWAGDVAAASTTCRGYATALQSEVDDCRQFLATAEPGSTCTITVNRGDGSSTELSIDQADAQIASWLGTAGYLDLRLTDIVDHRDQMLGDEAAIRGYGFSRRAEDFAEWEQASAELQGEAIKLTLEGLWDSAWAGVDKLKPFLLGITRSGARQLKRRAEALGVDNPHALQLIGKLHKVKHEKRKLAKVDEALEELGRVKDLVLMEGETGGWDAAGQRLLTIANWFNKNPFTKAVTADLRLAASLVWGELTEEAIAGLDKLTESDLLTLRDRSESAKAHLAEIQSIYGSLYGCSLP
jgi:hypothetical protein